MVSGGGSTISPANCSALRLSVKTTSPSMKVDLMLTRPIRCLSAMFLIVGSCAPCLGQGSDLPGVGELPYRKAMPDPLVMQSGKKVASPDEWPARRDELKQLFEHYMYGKAPPAPEKIQFEVTREEKDYFDGQATLREVTIHYGPAGAPPIHLLFIAPNSEDKSPVVLGLNFCGNHTLLDDPKIALPKVWMPNRCPGCEGNKATDKGRGTRLDRFDFAYAIERGYAVATFYHGDIDPDVNDFDNGVHPFYRERGEKQGPHDWACIAAWAWGLSRAIDYLEQDDKIDDERIIVYGHSRNGKTALLCGAFDERAAIVIPHQAGCGGSSPSRSEVGEQLRDINSRFPHWFCRQFHQFNEKVGHLPIDQNCLIALCAPRPVLLTNAIKDQWADPTGQFAALRSAYSVYQFLDAPGLEAEKQPPLGQPVLSHLGYYIREGGHSVTRDDWKVFLDFADRRFGRD